MGLVMRSVAILVVACIVTGCGLMPYLTKQKEFTLEEGRQLEAEGKYIEAIAYYQNFRDPVLREVCLNNLRYSYGQILEAMQAREQEPDSADAHYAVGDANYQKSLALPEESEMEANLWFSLPEYFSDQREIFQDRALDAVETATQLRPNHHDALLLEGILYESKHQPEKALQLYRQLLDLHTESPEAFYRLGQLLYERGQVKEGLKLAQQAVALGPESPSAHFFLGLLYASEGRDDEALEHFHESLCLDPYYIDVYYKTSHLYMNQQNLIDAERILRLGFINNPDNLPLGLAYASLQAVLDSKAQQMGGDLYEKLVTEDTGLSLPESPTDQILLYRLQINMVKRQKPYLLPCLNQEEHPYFQAQITLLESKIEKVMERYGVKKAEE